MWEGSRGLNNDCGEGQGDFVDEIETSTFTTYNHMTILKSVVTSILIGCMVGFLLLFQQFNSTVLDRFSFVYFIVSIFTSLISPHFIAKLKIRTPIMVLPILMVVISFVLVYVYIKFYWIKMIISYLLAPIICELLWNSLGGYIISYGHHENLYFNFGIIFGISSIFLNIKLYTYNLNILFIISGSVSIICSIVLYFLCGKAISEQLDENNKSVISYLSSFIMNIKSIDPLVQILIPPVVFIGYFQLMPISYYSRGLSTLDFNPFGYNLTNVLTGLISFLFIGAISSRLVIRKILLFVTVFIGILGFSVVIGRSFFVDANSYYYISAIFTMIPTNCLIIITYTAIGLYFSDSPLFGFALIRVFYNVGSFVISILPFYVSDFGVIIILILFVIAFICTLIHSLKLKDNQLNTNKYYQVSKATWI